jgi:hypothetical protein
MAVEQSARSLILGENAVRMRVALISSLVAIKCRATTSALMGAIGDI